MTTGGAAQCNGNAPARRVPNEFLGDRAYDDTDRECIATSNFLMVVQSAFYEPYVFSFFFFSVSVVSFYSFY